MPIIPHLVVNDGLKALDWYEQALGAKRLNVNMAPDGQKVFHAVLSIAGGEMFLCDDFGMGCGKAMSTGEKATVMLALTVDNADATVAKAAAAGATIEMAVQDTFWGARFGMIRDPFGHVWEVNQQVREVGEAEIKQATEDHFAQQK